MKKSRLLFLPILLTFSLYSSKATKEYFDFDKGVYYNTDKR